MDLRWFDGAWPSGLQALNKLLLVDMGLYGFLAIRQLSGVGFDFCFRWSDWKTGFRELIFFTPFVLTLGLALGFIHPHANRPQVGTAASAMGADIPFHRAAGRTFLSRVGTESAGTPLGAPHGARHRLGAIRTVAFQ